MTTKNPQLTRAAKRIGSMSEIARLCGVSHSAVQQWHGNGVPAKHCRKIEQATNGEVTAYDLRPDVFGRPELRA